jgi:uncharacterized membrane protein
MSSNAIIETLIILTFLGLLNASCLHWQYVKFKKEKRPMSCPIGGECSDVIDSKFGKIFGIKNEVIGMTYYSFLLILLASMPYISDTVFQEYALITFFAITLNGALFSFYLLFVQKFVLKKYCSWCILSSVINILIFYIFVASATN